MNLMDRVVTKRQSELLGIIYSSIKDEGFPPTLQQLRAQLGVVSNQAVLDILKALENKKLIKRTDKSARSILILPLGYKLLNKQPLISLLGSAQAGMFTQALELNGEWLPVSSDVIQFQARTYVIKVAGDSMINAQIEDGSTLLIQETDYFSTGDIVIASTPQGVTLKRFISQDAPPYMFLKPENPKYDNILFGDDIELQGKAVAKLEGEMWRPFKQGALV